MKFLITAGATREYIDPVRYISNASTGKMGYSLAQTLLRASHEVTLISANVNIPAPPHAQLVTVVTADEMFTAVKANFDDCDCLIMAAAVSDYTPQHISQVKIKKSSDQLTLKLKPTQDILKWAGANKADKFIVGFALEDSDIFENAERKMRDKNLDMIVANLPAAIGAEQSEVFVKTRKAQWLELGQNDKSHHAEKIVSMILENITRIC